MSEIVEAAANPGSLPGGLPRFFPIANWSRRVRRVNARLEVVAGGPTLFRWENVMLRLAVRELTGPHIEHHARPVIKRNRPARARLGF